MKRYFFLSSKDVLNIHKREIEISGGEPNIRDKDGVKACTEAPKASFDGEYLQDIFAMAASYISCLTIRHPFVDGNKRTALASALTFLYLNGFKVEESHNEELADLVLDFLSKKVSKDGLADHLKINAISV
jgi:death-on-curing protein